MVVAVAQSAVSQLSAGRWRGGERSVGLYFFKASVRSVRHFFRLVSRCFSSCVYGGCRSAIGRFAVVCRALKGWGKERWSIFLYRASVRSVRHFFRLVFRCFSSCVYGGCRSAIGSFAVVCRALKRWGKERWSIYFFKASVRSVRHFFRLVFRCFSSCVYGGCRSAIGRFAVVCRALKRWGKERWSIFL